MAGNGGSAITACGPPALPEAPPSLRRAPSLDRQGLRRLWAVFQAWRHSDDRLVDAANTIALVVAWNTPFYPLYVWWVAGSEGMPVALLSLCAFPLYLLVPELTRRSSRLGRAALPILGVANTMFCTWLLGQQSGTELFYLPCIVIGALLFRPPDRWLRRGLIVLPIAALIGLHGGYGAPPHRYSAAHYDALFSMNLFSVATLTGFLGLVFAPPANDG